MKKILILGTGGHAKSCIDLISRSKKFKLIGLISKSPKIIGNKILNKKIIGSDKDLKSLAKKYKNIMIGIGFIGKSKKKELLFKKLLKLGFTIPTIISPSSCISKFSKIEEGVNIFHNCIIGPGATIKKGAILNNGSLIEHDVEIGSFSHVSTFCVINGEVLVGSHCFIGSGSIIKNQCVIKKNSFIKMGSRLKK